MLKLELAKKNIPHGNFLCSLHKRTSAQIFQLFEGTMYGIMKLEYLSSIPLIEEALKKKKKKGKTARQVNNQNGPETNAKFSR